MSWLTLDRLVRDICRLRNDPAAKMYPKVATAVLRSIDQFTLASFPCIRTTEHDIDSLFTVPISDGVAVVTKVGVLKGENIVMARELNSMELSRRGLEIDADLGCEVEVTNVSLETGPATEADPTNSRFFNYYNDRTGNFGELYGVSTPDNRPCFTVDYKKCRVVFDTSGIELGDKVIIEQSMFPGAGEESEIMIPRDAFDMIYHWSIAYLTDVESPGVANNHRVSAGNAKAIFDRRHGSWSLEDIFIYYRGGYQPAIK